MKKKIILVLGDPNSINSEIIYKSWKKLNKTIKKNLVEVERSKKLTEQIMKIIKDVPQDETKGT